MNISTSLATYLKAAYDPFFVNRNSNSDEFLLKLEMEYQQIKKNLTVEQLYEKIALKWVS